MQSNAKDFAVKALAREWFGGVNASSRFFVALAFFLVLNLLLAFKDARVEMVSLGKIAKRFVASQADFSFNDKAAAQLLRQQAQFEIGPIYRLDERSLQSSYQAIQAQLVSDTKWKEEVSANYQEVFDVLEKARLHATKVRFADPRTIKKINELGPPDGIRFFPAAAQGSLPADFWKQLFEKTALDGEKKCRDFALHQIERGHVNVYSDGEMENRYRRQAASQVKPVTTTIKAGDVLVAPGDLITEEHVESMQKMKQALNKKYSIWNIRVFTANVLISFLVSMLGIAYLKTYYAGVFNSINKLSLLVSILILSLLLRKGIELFLMNSGVIWHDALRYPGLYVFSCILITLFVGRTIAIFSLLFLVILSLYLFAFDAERFAIMNLVGALTAIFVCKRIHYRRQIFTCYVKVWVSLIPLLAAYHFTDSDTSIRPFLFDIAGELVFLTAMALFTVALLPIIERAFDLVTDMTLSEFLDPNHELLRRLSMESPGTYQHCLVVGHLAEAAARSVGGNDLFCRVATLYHDIGKLYHPQYFAENQLGGFNIHQLLSPKESVRVIIAHVTEGEAMARKHRLPTQVIDVIKEHHGNTFVYYFYAKELEFQKDDHSKVDPLDFRYPGPKPRSKESAIIMIADCVEAASRCLESLTEHSLEGIVDKIIREKQFDGQFDDCQLTFEDVGKIRRAIVKALMVSHHSRIKYPPKELNQEGLLKA